MNNASPFYIYISNTPIQKGSSSSSSGGGSSSSGGSFKWPSDKGTSSYSRNNFLSKYVLTRVGESAVHTIERSWMENIQSIGYLQGDYVKETSQQEEMSMAQRIGNIAVVAGAAVVTGHFIVAGIDVVVGAINMAIDSYYDNRKNEAQNNASNYNAEQISKRAGLSSTRDGSRGTEN